MTRPIARRLREIVLSFHELPEFIVSRLTICLGPQAFVDLLKSAPEDLTLEPQREEAIFSSGLFIGWPIYQVLDGDPREMYVRLGPPSDVSIGRVPRCARCGAEIESDLNPLGTKSYCAACGPIVRPSMYPEEERL